MPFCGEDHLCVVTSGDLDASGGSYGEYDGDAAAV